MCRVLILALAIAGIVFGILGSKKADQGQATNKGQARAGLICGVVGAVLGASYGLRAAGDVREQAAELTPPSTTTTLPPTTTTLPAVPPTAAVAPA